MNDDRGPSFFFFVFFILPLPKQRIMSLDDPPPNNLVRTEPSNLVATQKYMAIIFFSCFVHRHSNDAKSFRLKARVGIPLPPLLRSLNA